MADFPIVDAHVHIYDPSRMSYPWLAEAPALQAGRDTADFLAAAAPVAIEAFVFVEVDCVPEDQVAEAEFVTAAAATEPRLGAMVASVRMDRGDETARALAEMRRFGLLRGIRHLIQGHTGTPGYACRPEMIDGVRLLGAHDLSFDICIRHSQMRDATALVVACPDVRFVLDHIGKPDIRGGRFDPWREEIAALARLPNVWCKISGVATEADHHAWTEADLAPFISHAVGVFGYDRVMFGGDWPVCELATSYPRWVGVVDRATAAASASERDRLFRTNARAFYRV
jgi:L-fuconolactonase